MKKVALIVGGLVVVAVAVAAYFVLWPIVSPKPFPAPARLMPPGAYAYLAVENLENVVGSVEGSKWFASIVAQLRADPETSKLLDQVGDRIKKQAPLLGDRATLMSLIGRHLALAVYPGPKPDKLNVLVAIRAGTRALFLKLMADMSAKFQKAPALAYTEYLGQKVGQFPTDVGPVYFFVTENNVGFVSDRRPLIEAVVGRAVNKQRGSLFDDADYGDLMKYAGSRRRIIGFARLDHPAAAKLIRTLFLTAYGLGPDFKMPTPEAAAKMPPAQKKALAAMNKALGYLVSVRRFMVASDLLTSRSVAELAPGQNALKTYYTRLIDGRAKATHLDLIPKVPTFYLGYAGINLGHYLKEVAEDPKTAAVLQMAARWMGFASSDELGALLGDEIAVVTFGIEQSGLVPLPQVMVLVKAKSAAAAQDLVGRILKGLDTIKNKPFQSLRTERTGRGKIIYATSLVGDLGLAVMGPWIVFGNNKGYLEKLLKGETAGGSDPAWALIRQHQESHGSVMISFKRIFDEVPKIASLLALGGGRDKNADKKKQIFENIVMPLVDLASILTGVTAWSGWDGRDRLTWGGRLFVTDRALTRKLPLEAIRDALKNMLEPKKRIERPEPPRPLPRRNTI